MLGIRRVVGKVRVLFRAICFVPFPLLVLSPVLSGAAPAYFAGAALAFALPPEGRPPIPMTAEVRARTRILINVPSFTLSLYAGDRLIGSYPIAVGTMVKPTAVGEEAAIVNRVVDPTWYPEGRCPVPPGPDNPVGTRWLGLSLEGLGIHGTNTPDSIGKPASSGCIRLNNADVEELYDLVRIGTPVFFTYETIAVYPEPSGRSVYVTVYPDVYQRGSNSSAHLAAHLEEAGVRIAPQVGASAVEAVLRCADGRPKRFPAAVDVFVGGEKIPTLSAVWSEETLWVPAAGIALLLGAKVELGPEKAALIHRTGARFDERSTVVVAGERVRIVNGRLYLSLEDVTSAFQARAEFSAAERAVYVFALPASRLAVE